MIVPIPVFIYNSMIVSIPVLIYNSMYSAHTCGQMESIKYTTVSSGQMESELRRNKSAPVLHELVKR